MVKANEGGIWAVFPMGEGVDAHLHAEHDVRAEGKRARTPSDEALSASPSSSNKHHKLDEVHKEMEQG